MHRNNETMTHDVDKTLLLLLRIIISVITWMVIVLLPKISIQLTGIGGNKCMVKNWCCQVSGTQFEKVYRPR